jgi:hypothetical protein
MSLEFVNTTKEPHSLHIQHGKRASFLCRQWRCLVVAFSIGSSWRRHASLEWGCLVGGFSIGSTWRRHASLEHEAVVLVEVSALRGVEGEA